MFGVPVPPVLSAFVAFLGEPTASGATSLRPVAADDPCPWVPPEVRVFAIARDGTRIGVVVSHPEHPVPDWPIVRYSRKAGAISLGETARAGLAALLEVEVAEVPDPLCESLLQVRLAVASAPSLDWPAMDAFSGVDLPDGIRLVLPRGSVALRDFSAPPGRTASALVPWIRRIGVDRPGSALALGRSACFEAFRAGEDALALEVRSALGPMYRALDRHTYADEVTPGGRTTPGGSGAA